MIILHIANLRNDPFTGVCVAAPDHIRYQGKIAEVALLNINDCMIDGIDCQYIYRGNNWKDDVPPKYRQPDIVVFHEVYHIEFVRISKSLEKDGIPFVIIPHGCLVKAAQHKKWWKKKIANALFFRGFIMNASALQLLSDNEMNNTGFKVNKFIGTNGVCLPLVSKNSFRENLQRIVYIGRLEIIPKGIDLLLQAVRMICMDSNNTRNKFVLDIFGPDVKGRYAEVEQLIKDCHVENIVTLNHELIGQEKQECLLDTDVFIQTSRHEGMPMGILEAMSYGVPCLITEGTSLGGVVCEYNAGWVAKNSVESIARTIIDAINEKSKEKTQKSENARKLIDEKFSWDVIVGDTIEKYKKICFSTLNKNL